jgi:4-amino-4-deoxy-L-arabinose transferase-like glycosyltransferase
LSPGTHASSRSRKWRTELFVPLAVALALRLLLIAMAPTVPSWDGVIYARAAEQLAHGEGYTLRILHEANSPAATAFYPVGFPAVLAGVRLLGGGLLADRLLQAVASSLLVALSYLFARRVRGRRAGRIAAWLTALWPGGILLAATWLAEPVFALGVGLSLLPITYAKRRQRARALAIAALGLGLMAYLRASSLPMAALLGLALGYSWLHGRPLLRRAGAALLLAAVLTGLACVPLAPWAYRNQQRLGSAVLVSTNGGVNLLLGTRGDGGFASIAEGEECKGGGLRETERNRCYSRRAIRAIAADPVAWLGRGLLKLVHTFGHESAPAQCFGEGLQLPEPAKTSWRLWALGLCRAGWLLIMCAAAAGALPVARGSSSVSRAVLFAPIVALAGLHAAYLGGDRYHAAVAPMVLALAGIGLASVTRRPPTALGRTDTISPDRLDVPPHKA